MSENEINTLFEKLKELPSNTEISISQLIGPNALKDYTSELLFKISNQIFKKCKDENIKLDFSKHTNQKMGLIFNIPFIKK